jgi:hypothetical protein
LNKLTDALITGALGLGLTVGAYAADVTRAEKNGADARYEAAADKARADYKLAKERCNTLSGNDKDVCVKRAEAEEQRVRADAKARKEAAKAGDEANKEKREAEYEVAKEKCDSLSAAAKDLPRRSEGTLQGRDLTVKGTSWDC